MEIMATNNLPELLQQGKVWTYPNSSYFLVEFFYDEEEEYFDWLLDRCAAAGFTPVIAHPERYRAVRQHPEMAEQWQKKGYGVQVNRDSLLGLFGENAFYCADLLLRKGWANCIASDAHTPQFRNSHWGEAFRKLPGLYGFYTLARCLETIPQRILENRPLIER
jgi:protein-tyrosine phosphatase